MTYEKTKLSILLYHPLLNFCYTFGVDVLSIIFPKRCVICKKLGSYLCANCFAKISFSDHEMCLPCGKNSIDGFTHPRCQGRYTIDGAFTSILYKGVVKKLIYVFKYQPYVSHLSSTLNELFYEGIIQKEGAVKVFSNQPIVVAIPLHSSKYKKRGYNQAEILAKGLAKRLDLQTFSVLERIKPSVSQTKFNREQRKQNIKGAFVVKNSLQNTIKGKTIILIDDVLTTGATVSEAANVMKRNGAKQVYGFFLAKD